jgi:hypothetical protein
MNTKSIFWKRSAVRENAATWLITLSFRKNARNAECARKIARPARYPEAGKKGI